MADTIQDQLPNWVLVGTLPHIHISNAVHISNIFTPWSKVLFFHFPYNMKWLSMSSWHFIMTCKRRQLQQMRVLLKAYYWLESYKRTALYCLRSMASSLLLSKQCKSALFPWQPWLLLSPIRKKSQHTLHKQTPLSIHFCPYEQAKSCLFYLHIPRAIAWE